MLNKNIEEYEPIGRSKASLNLEKMSETDLLVLRANVDAMLPITKLSDLNLERELTLQFRVAQALQTLVMADTSTPANQKAQVMNSVSATIQSLVKMQLDYYTPERLKKIEAALVTTLNSWPAEQTAEFFVKYEQLLEG